MHGYHSVRWLLPVKLWRMPCISNPVVFVVWCLWMLALLVVWFVACTPALLSMSFFLRLVSFVVLVVFGLRGLLSSCTLAVFGLLRSWRFGT